MIYVRTVNEDQAPAVFSLPDDLVQQLQTESGDLQLLQGLNNNRHYQQLYGLKFTPHAGHQTQEGGVVRQHEAPPTAEQRHTPLGEWTIAESMSLPFYLNYTGLRTVVGARIEITQSLTISILLAMLVKHCGPGPHELRTQRGRDAAFRAFSASYSQFEAQLANLSQSPLTMTMEFQHEGQEYAVPILPADLRGSMDSATGHKLPPLVLHWRAVYHSRVLILPSILLLDTSRTAEFWYNALRLLCAVQPSIRVYPAIEVESQMEHKDSYLMHLAQIPRASLPTAGLAAAPAAASAMPTQFPDSPSFILPTVLIDSGIDPSMPDPTPRQLRTITAQLTTKVTDAAQTLLQRARDGLWLSWPGRNHNDPIGRQHFVLKGTNGSRKSAVTLLAEKSVDEIVEIILQQAMVADCKRARQQKFLLQMRSPGLREELRLYYLDSRFIGAILTGNSSGSTSEITTTEIRAGCAPSPLIQMSHSGSSCRAVDVAHRIIGELIPFGLRILQHCEDHCGLLTNSSLLRVDFGIDITRFKFEASTNCTEMHQEHQRRGIDSMIVGQRGLTALTLARPFLNEVTSSLDITLFTVSCRGNAPARCSSLMT